MIKNLLSGSWVEVVCGGVVDDGGVVIGESGGGLVGVPVGAEVVGIIASLPAVNVVENSSV